MPGMKINPDKIGDMDEMDLNAFSIKPDALIYFTIAQIIGISAKGIDGNKSVTDICIMKSMMVDDLESLCDSQGYIQSDIIDEATQKKKDPYFILTEKKTEELKLNDQNIVNSDEYWRRRMILSGVKFNALCKRVFGSVAKYTEISY